MRFLYGIFAGESPESKLNTLKKRVESSKQKHLEEVKTHIRKELPYSQGAANSMYLTGFPRLSTEMQHIAEVEKVSSLGGLHLASAYALYKLEDLLEGVDMQARGCPQMVIDKISKIYDNYPNVKQSSSTLFEDTKKFAEKMQEKQENNVVGSFQKDL